MGRTRGSEEVSGASLLEDDGLYGTGILFEEPNNTGSRPRDLIGLCKPQETREGTKRRRPKKPGGGRERKREPTYGTGILFKEPNR